MKTLFDKFFENLIRFGLEYFKRYYGIYRAVCIDNKDPEQQGRILVRVPAVTMNDTHPVWAWPVMPWAGKDSGFFMVPDVEDPVMVCFENGDPRVPMWVGGYWPKVNGTNFAPAETYNAEGTPTKRIFKTKAGHEFSFEDDPTNQSVKLVWHDAAKDKYTFFAVTSDGSIQMANHKGCFMELRATDDDERTLIMDKAGNLITQDKDGTKVADASGNVIELKKNAVQVIGTKDVIVNAPSVNIKAGGVTIGDVVTDSTVKGTAFMAWWKATFLTWLNTHTHPTGVGPSGPPAAPHIAPVDKVVLTDILKVQ